MPVAAPHTPVLLSAETTIASGSQNGLRNEALRNPFDVPIEIMEMRFHGSQTQVARLGNGNLGPPLAGNAVQIALELGGLKLTNGVVPMWNFGRAENPTGEVLPGTTSNGATPTFYNEYDWKLARPVVIPPGMGISVTAVSTGLVLDPITFRASCLARVCGRKYSAKDPVRIPWIAPWISKQLQVGLATTDTSRETDLITPAGRDMLLHWLTARMGVWDPSAAVNDDVSLPTMAYTLAQVKLRDSRGYPLVRNYTYWSTAFNQLVRAWTMDGQGFKIPADTYWIADLLVSALTLTTAYRAQAALAMVGSYEVAYGDIQ